MAEEFKVKVGYTISGLPSMLYRELRSLVPYSTDDIKDILTEEVQDLFEMYGVDDAKPLITIWSKQSID